MNKMDINKFKQTNKERLKRLKILFHALLAFLASFNNSKTLFDKYLCLNGLLLFLSGCVFIKAFLHTAVTCSGFKSYVKDIEGHYGHISCSVDNKVVRLFNVLAPEYPHF